MPSAKCPVCERAFDVNHSQAMPFCSERCRQVDLGRWLNEDYGVPVERSDEEHDEEIQ